MTKGQLKIMLGSMDAHGFDDSVQVQVKLLDGTPVDLDGNGFRLQRADAEVALNAADVFADTVVQPDAILLKQV
jgi:hypothetical protein